MEKFLGILFAGGRGTRLGMITKYISKAFVPIYDRPVFMYPLAQLVTSRYVDEIIVLTNDENDDKLRRLGYQTIIQDDRYVHNMFSGLKFIKEVVSTRKHFVLMPCDNVSDIGVDETIEVFIKSDVDICFNLVHIENKGKLAEMGVFDTKSNRMYYKPKRFVSNWGVVTPYVIRNSFELPEGITDDIINESKFDCKEHTGYWFDVGDVRSLSECNDYLAKYVKSVKS